MTFNNDERGSIGTIIAVSILSLFLVGSVVFGIWAFVSRDGYKNHSDQKSAEAVTAALEVQKGKLEIEFDEREKQPYESYQGPSEFGSINIVFPKTWELYVDAKSGVNSSAQPVDGYAHPGYAPGIQSDTAFALRFQVLERDLATELRSFDGLARNGSVKISPFRAPKVESILGNRIDGQISQKRKGSMVILPMRDKVLKVWTESDVYQPDFTEILKNLSFSP